MKAVDLTPQQLTQLRLQWAVVESLVMLEQALAVPEAVRDGLDLLEKEVPSLANERVASFLRSQL